jgi:DNA-binding transcriptional ArsR family regulator
LPIITAVGDVFKALADPTRRTILDELTERDGQTLFELCARLTTRHGLGSTRQAISQHLAVLEEAGLIRTRKEGRYKFHDLQREPLERLAGRWLVPRRTEDP